MDDKKKLMALGALVLVMLGVGVFQITKGSDAPAPAPVTEMAPPKKAADTAKVAVKGPELKNPIVSKAYNERDPFRPVDAVDKPVEKTPDPKPAQEAPKPAPAPSVSAPKLAPLPPMQIDTSGKLPPGDISASGKLPAAVPSAPVFGFHLSGVIMGDRPAAVFVDGQGNEKIVAVGSSIDGSSHLVSVSKAGASVRFNGKVLNLTPGGNESGN